MEIIEIDIHNPHLEENEKLHLCLGFYDGLHIGHQKIINEAHEEAIKLSEILDGDAKEEAPERVASKEPEKTSETDEVIKPPKRGEEKETKEAPEEEEVAEEAKPVKLDVPPRRTHDEKEDEEVDGKTEET